MVAFVALSGVAVGATVVSQKLIEQRLDSEIAKAKANGIDLEDLYYDFDLPGDAYPFGDAEGMDWVIVNGRTVIREGRFQKTRAGKLLLHSAPKPKPDATPQPAPSASGEGASDE